MLSKKVENEKRSYDHFVSLIFFGFLLCRKNNNRREYCEERERKDGVHACVLRIFFSLRALVILLDK